MMARCQASNLDMQNYHVSIGGIPLCESCLPSSVIGTLEENGMHVTCGHQYLHSARKLAGALCANGYLADVILGPCPNIRRSNTP
jgi:hypothetical protein